MRKITSMLITITISSLTFFLFLVGLGVMLALLVAMLLIGVFLKASTRQQWRERWTENWKNRHTAYYDEHHKQRQAQVIEGEYTVKSH